MAGEIWKNLEEQARHNLKFSKASLTGDSGRYSEDYSAGRNVKSQGHADEVSDRNEKPIENFTKTILLHNGK